MSSVQPTFADLEHRMKSLAAEDGDIYLPNVLPAAPVCYVFICMEPSLTGWAGPGGDKAKSRLAEGFRNFLWSMDDFILHHSIQHYLLKPGQWHHVTDVSKGAMTVNKAQVERGFRYRRWYGLLLEELELLARPDARYFAVGHAVANCLDELHFPFPFDRILHYSGQAAKSRKKSVEGHESEFVAFRETLSAEDILNTAHKLLVSSGMSAALRNEILLRLNRSGPLSESRKMLAFHYNNRFQKFLNVHAP